MNITEKPLFKGGYYSKEFAMTVVAPLAWLLSFVSAEYVAFKAIGH
ncbi:hypothetical protein IVA95_36895 [Bradyrhizobium sp. 157]|nr:hypothetical protein [Bradyrhizobium sp. 157]MCK1642992.1 hypothetical protein [Bradyrhizobium sp. 157]